jgi:hypothetical protein
MSASLEFDGSDLGVFKRISFARAVSRWIEEVSPEIEESIKNEAPKRTGALKDSITHRKSFGFSGVAVEYGSRLPYASYVEEGTPPHIIRARNVKNLRFQGRSGDIVYAPYVNHPGTRPNPFSQRAVERILPELQSRFAEDVESEFRKA